MERYQEALSLILSTRNIAKNATANCGMWDVEGIPTVHRCSIRVIANEPVKCWLSLSCRLDIDNSFNDPTHIFNKTGCENRAAAAAFALRHGLA